MTAYKIAASISAEQFRALEETRRKLKLSRSEAVQQALALWLTAQSHDPRVEQYVRAYQAQPEDTATGEALVKAWSTGLPHETW